MNATMSGSALVGARRPLLTGLVLGATVGLLPPAAAPLLSVGWWVPVCTALLVAVAGVVVPLALRRHVPAYLPRLPSSRSLAQAAGLAVTGSLCTAVMTVLDAGPLASGGAAHLSGWVLAWALGSVALAMLVVAVARAASEGIELHLVSRSARTLLAARVGVVVLTSVDLVYWGLVR